MYEIIKNVINSKDYELSEMLYKINKMYIESAITETEESTEPEEYPEYKAPSGAHDAYNTGDKITFKGKKYICTMDNCVWSPEVYPQGWEEVL